MSHWVWEILRPLSILLQIRINFDLKDQALKQEKNAIFLDIVMVAWGFQNYLMQVLVFSLVISFLSPCGSMALLGIKLLKYDMKVER